MNSDKLIGDYLSGPKMLAQAIAGMSDHQVNAAPVPGKWSTRQVVCHLAGFEPVYVDRMKRVIAEDKPTIFGGDPNLFAARLAYDQRDLNEDLRLVAAARGHMGPILRSLKPDDFQRVGLHSVEGLMTLQTLLERITNHIPHHVKFIQEKRAILG